MGSLMFTNHLKFSPLFTLIYFLLHYSYKQLISYSFIFGYIHVFGLLFFLLKLIIQCVFCYSLKWKWNYSLF